MTRNLAVGPRETYSEAMRDFPKALLLTSLLAVAAIAAASPALARLEATSGYTKSQTYNCVLRFLRVDLGYKIVEKDAEAAYVLFHYPQPGQKTPGNGALEVIETPTGVKLVVQLPKLPAYHETVLRDGLLRKLRDEYGPPPSKVPPPAKNPPPAKPQPPADGDDGTPKKPENPQADGEQ